MYINNVRDYKMNNEFDLLEKATKAFQEETGLLFKIDKTEIKAQGQIVDAIVTLKAHKRAKFFVLVKRWAQQANFGALVYQTKRLPGNGLLVADYINRKMAVRLKDRGVQFIDTAGNAYINCPPIYVNIRGNDPQTTLTTTNHIIKYAIEDTATGRAFTLTGLKVVYALLCDHELVTAPLRQVAENADVALGTVGWVFNDLKAARLLIARGKNKKLIDYRKLLTRWAEAYPIKLRPKLNIGTFTHDDPYWWKNIKLKELDAYWGGEVAAAKLTNYLKPATATLYLRGDLNHLVKQARLRKAKEGDNIRVEVFRPFWPEADNYTETVHPLIVYADLLVTADPRNLETAEEIYERYLDRHNGQT